MEDNTAPCVQDAEVEGFRRNLATSDARADFYEPITHPFPVDPSPEPDDLKVEEQGLTCDVPTRLAPSLGDAEETTPTSMLADDAEEPELKRSVSQAIIDAAYRTVQDVTSEVPVDRDVSIESTAVEIDVIKDASTKSLFNSLITSPSRVSSRMSRRGSADNPAPLGTTVDMTEVDEVLEVRGSVAAVKDVERPRYYSNRATTLPAKLECKVFDPATHPKLTRWELFKRKFYLGAANSLQTPPRAVDTGALEADTPRASTAGPIDMDSFCEVTNIEGLDLEGIPPMTQRSRKLFSWTRLKTGLTGFKRRAGKEVKSDDDGPKGEPDEAVVRDDEEDDDDVCSQDEGAATSSAKTPTKDKSHSWFEVLSHRLFTATRRQRVVEDAPARPATAHTQQYYEIESNW